MDNLGDWLYIVFLVIAVISGLFSSGKKKKAAGQASPQPKRTSETSSNTEKEKGFWELLEEMQNKPQEVPAPRVKKQMPVKTEPRKVAAHAPYLTTEVNIPEMKGNWDTPSLLEEPQENNYSVSSKDFHIRDVEEIRKAIIYNEIINRKY